MIDMDNKYKNGKIYRIWSSATEDFYIGSTVQPLYKRMCEHRCHSRMSRNHHRKSFSIMTDIGQNSFRIELVEHYACSSRSELLKREGEVIRQLKPQLNTVMAGRTFKEYYVDHKEDIKNKCKVYRETHQDLIKTNSLRYYTQNKDSILHEKHEYYERNKDRISDYQREYRQSHKSKLNSNCRVYYLQHREELKQKAKSYREQNKEAIQERGRVVVLCEACNCHIHKSDRAKHERTKKHLRNIN
jgi:hypothetical protein